MPVIGFQHHIRVAIAMLTKLGSQYKFLYREYIIKHNKQLNQTSMASLIKNDK